MRAPAPEAAGGGTPANRLVVFVKAPRRGFVKTRVAAVLGPEAALECYRTLAERVLANVASLRTVELCFTPDDALEEIRPWLRAGWDALPQGEGDLGARLPRAFAAGFATGAQRVVIIGSDSPDVTAADIEQAWQALDASDVVLGPARDGGYWLVGLSRPQPRLFAGIPWSTSRVFALTVRRAAALGLRVTRLRPLSDVDTAADWHAFLAVEPRSGSVRLSL